MIAMRYDEPAAPRVYDVGDLPWVEHLIDIAYEARGKPWRELAQRIEHATMKVPQAQRTAMLAALRRQLGGSPQAQQARQLRALVLGAPAVIAGRRHERIARVARQVGRTPEEVEASLWVDLAMERPVLFPAGRPTARDVVAVANLELLMRAARRSHELRIRCDELSIPFAREAMRCGLVLSVKRDDNATTLEVLGPQDLPHATIGYGRALAGWLACLTEQQRFVLDVRCDLGGKPRRLRAASPMILPRYARPVRAKVSAGERLERDLVELGHEVLTEPPPIQVAHHVLLPELSLVHRGERWQVEVLGYSPANVSAQKRRLYRRADASVVLCVDRTLSPGCDLAPGICGYVRCVDIDDLLATLDSSR